MALTNFAALTDEQLTAWSKKIWRTARNKMFINKFMGTDENAMIHRITELKKTEKGTRAVITLVHDLEGDGVTGDRYLEGNEEEMKQSDIDIRVDMLRNAVRSAGRMAEQKSVVNFRNHANNNLSYWLADRCDQMAFLTLSGVSYAMKNNGPARGLSDLVNLEFAADVTAPTDGRHLQWDASLGLIDSSNGAFGTANIVAGDTPTYDLIVDLKAHAHDSYIRPLRTVGGVEWFNLFMTAKGVAALKKDQDFKDAFRQAMPRTPDHPMFKGTDVIWLDGVAIHTYRHVFNTTGLPTGSKWGGGAVDGQRMLLCGAQALGMADFSMPFWEEENFDYKNQPGISVGKITGMRKPKFHSIYSGTTEDYGVIAIDTAI